MKEVISVVRLTLEEARNVYDAVTGAVDSYVGTQDFEVVAHLHSDLEYFICPEVVGAKAADRDKFRIRASPAEAGAWADALDRCVAGGRLPPSAVPWLSLLATRLRRAHLHLVEGERS